MPTKSVQEPAVRLERIHQAPESSEAHNGAEDLASSTAYPPPDQGKQAWLFLAACVVVEVLVWGFSFTFGILQENYETGPFKGQGSITAIGTTASGVVYLSAPVSFWFFERYARTRRSWGFLGTGVMVAALIGSSFANDVPQLIATQGVLYALGCSLVYTPTIFYLDQWFHKRKGLAFGIMYAGTGIGGVIMPFSFNAALSVYSFRTVLRGYALIVFVLLMPMLFYIRPRIPPAQQSSTDLQPSAAFSFLRDPLFWLFQLGNVIQALGFFLPPFYLPTYIIGYLGGSNTLGTLSVVLFNLASVVGCVGWGALIDKMHVATCLALLSVGSTLSVLAVWGFANTIGITLAFSVMYGIFAGSFVSTWSGVMRLTNARFANASATMIFAFLGAGRGVGNIISGPVSEALLDLRETNGGNGPMSSNGYDGKYMPMIVFTGVSAFLGGVAIVSRIRLRQ